jgi:chromosome segregation ATPase
MTEPIPSHVENVSPENASPENASPQRHSTAASDSAGRERGKLIILMHNLEAALAAASFNRTDDWNEIVQGELGRLQQALRQSRAQLHASHGLFAEIAADHPRLISRIEKLKQEFYDLERQMETLQEQFRDTADAPEVADIRERLSWLLKALRHAQTRENELVFEAIGLDLGAGD